MVVKEKRVLPKGGWGLDYMPGGNVLMPYRLLREHLVRYVFASRYIKGKTVLDIACGSGYGADYILKKGAKKAVGADIDKNAISQAKESFTNEGLELILADATRLPFDDDSFDIIVSFETIEHIVEYRQYLTECKRILKKDGVFICSTPNVIVPGSEKAVNPYHVNEFNKEQLGSTLNDFFKNTEVYGQSFIILKKKGVIQHLADFVKTKMLWVPYIHILINSITRFAFREFRLVALNDIADYDILADEGGLPVLLTESSQIPENLVTVSVNDK